MVAYMAGVGAVRRLWDGVTRHAHAAGPLHAASGARLAADAGIECARAHAPPPMLPQARGIFSLVVDVLWTIFWLVAAGCVSSFLADVPDTSKLQASTA